MAQMIEITDFDAPELDVYARLTENQLINRHEPEKGMLREKDRRFLRGAGRSRSTRRSLMYSRS